MSTSTQTVASQVRQGDVYIKRIPAIPANMEEIPREHGRVILAHGEVTGHAHAISEAHVRHFRDTRLERNAERRASGDAATYRLRAGGPASLAFTYLEVMDNPATLRHEEHGPITLPPGCYEVRRQREYTPAGMRNVAD